MLPSPGTTSKLILLIGAVVSLSACSTMGQKSGGPANQALTTPTAVDADIQRILTAGGIAADDPVVAALQSPPPAVTNGSAWGADAPAVAQPAVAVATAAPQAAPVPTAFPATVDVAVVESTAGSSGVGVENIGQLDLSFKPVPESSTMSATPMTTTTTAMVPEGAGFIPNSPGLSPASNSMSSVPASVAAGILPAPNFTQTTMLTGPDVTEPQQPQASVPAKAKVVPIPVSRPADLYTRSTPTVQAAQIEPASIQTTIAVIPTTPAPVIAAPLPLPIVQPVAAPVKRF